MYPLSNPLLRARFREFFKKAQSDQKPAIPPLPTSTLDLTKRKWTPCDIHCRRVYALFFVLILSGASFHHFQVPQNKFPDWF